MKMDARVFYLPGRRVFRVGLEEPGVLVMEIALKHNHNVCSLWEKTVHLQVA